MKLRVVSEWILRVLLAGVFIYAGAVKLPDIQKFFGDILNYDLVSWDVSIVTAFLLPWLEIFAGLALITGVFYLGGVAICGILSSVFLTAISSAWYRGLDITCGCFGREDNQTNFPEHITLNAMMLLAAVVLWWAATKPKGTNTSVAGHENDAGDSGV